MAEPASIRVSQPPSITIFVHHKLGCKYADDESSKRCRCFISLASGVELGTAVPALLLMHSQPILSGVALDHHSPLNLFGQIRRLPKELRPLLNLRPAPKRSIVELLQSKLFEARHTPTC